MIRWQELVRRWHANVFGPRKNDHGAKIYSMRLLEESLELAQAENVSREDAETILKQVYDKPKGEPFKEFGGVLITAIGYANQANFDMEKAFDVEFERIQDQKLIDKIRYRNFHGDKIGLRDNW